MLKAFMMGFPYIIVFAFQFIIRCCTMRFFIWVLTCAVLMLGGARGASSHGVETEKDDFRSLQVLTPPVLVGAYYYPWHFEDFHGRDYLREKLQPRHLPVLGEYNDRNTTITRQHLKWCMDSNIFLWVMSWFGPATKTDLTSEVILNYMQNQTNTTDFPVSNFKVAMFYETQSRVRFNNATGLYDTSKVKSDFQNISSKYFSRPNYLKISGKPVVYVYLTRWLQGNKIFDSVIPLMREGAAAAGHPNIYIVGDHTFGNATSIVPATYTPFALLDAVTNYDVYGSMKKPLYAGNTLVDQYFAGQKVWSDKANAAGCDFIPSTTPGFNNMGYKNGTLGMPPMSRRLTKSSKEGSLFELMLTKAKAQVDVDTGKIMMITTFNEYHEDTQIEPVTSVQLTTSIPTSVTAGLTYQAYQNLYLDLVKKVTKG